MNGAPEAFSGQYIQLLNHVQSITPGHSAEHQACLRYLTGWAGRLGRSSSLPLNCSIMKRSRRIQLIVAGLAVVLLHATGLTAMPNEQLTEVQTTQSASEVQATLPGSKVQTESAEAPSSARFIESGEFHSVLPEVEGEPHQVRAFYMDETAVTNSQYREFLEANPEWSPEEITPLYAENGYLRHWSSATQSPDPDTEHQPVTRVSWFAANAYCGWNGGRLPTLNEWEYAAQAMDFGSAAEADAFSSELIGWYSSVDALEAEEVGTSGVENRYGVKDLFGLVMEWVEDFKPPMASGISLDCGTIGRMSGDPSIYTYAMSIRYITRMSFRPTSTTGMIGFRCAYDAPATYTAR